MRQLLVTSDDLGMAHAVNAGIVRAMTEGLVASSNLMAPCAWVFEAATLVRRHSLPVGIHLCATSEWNGARFRPLTDAPSLRRLDGSLPRNHAELAERVDYEELEAEFRAQIDFVRRLGVEPTHLDTHMIGAYDGSPHGLAVQAVVRKIARDERLPFTYERKTPESPRLLHFEDELVRTDRSLEETWRVLEGWTAPGRYHLITHAAVQSPELAALDGAPNPWAEAYRVRDLEFLLAPETRARIAALGFTLIDVSALSGP